MDQMIIPTIVASVLTLSAEAAPLVKWQDYDASVAIELQKNSSSTICSGIFLNPSVVLTTAHCLNDLHSAQVVVDFVRRKESSRFEVSHWKTHPNFKGNLVGESVDVGLIFLKNPVSLQMGFPDFAEYDLKIPFYRIGYGERQHENRRTLVTTNFDEWAGFYLRVNDQYGYPGDSGGPVYQKIDNELKLVGLHTGREQNDLGNLLNISYIQPLHAQNVINWIQTYSKI